MGTRNITRVISGGVRRIEQYCQWNGKPTGHIEIFFNLGLWKEYDTGE